MKVYAKQVPPEWQTSPWDGDEFLFNDDAAIFGGSLHLDRIPETVERVRDVLEDGDLAEELETLRDDREAAYYSSATEAIMDLLPPEHKLRYSTREIHEIREIVLAYGERGDDLDRLARLLSIVTGHQWDHKDLRGSCQGDQVELIYRSDVWTAEDLDRLEADYFNTGSEWIVWDEDYPPVDPEEIALDHGYSEYCYGWREDQIREEIAAITGADPGEVQLFPDGEKWAEIA